MGCPSVAAHVALIIGVLCDVVSHHFLRSGVLQWRPINRSRRFLILRYEPSFQSNANDPGNIPPAVVARLAPETRELIQGG